MSVYPSERLFKLLRAIIVLLVAVIIIGTVAAFVKKVRRTELEGLGGSETPASYSPPKEYALYGDLGQLRAVTADNPPVTVIVKPFLEYKSSDTAFQEELVAKKDSLKKNRPRLVFN